MLVRSVALVDFRNHRHSVFTPSPSGITALVGANGAGKTAVLEAIAYGARLSSFRGVAREVLVRSGAERGCVRLDVEREGRRLLIQAEAGNDGRGRALLNHKPVRRHADLAQALVVSVVAPEDRELVEGPPLARRSWLDDALVVLRPRVGEVRGALERVLRQRTALLRRVAGRLDHSSRATLEVLDTQLASVGEELVRQREEFLSRVEPLVQQFYRELTDRKAVPELRYARSWSGSLATALMGARTEDLRQQTTTVGPHRDDVSITLAGRPARGAASKGEARAVALALRLSVHALVTARLGEPPVVLLDDVLAELDPKRASRLLAALPAGQILLSATRLPDGGPVPASVVRVVDGSCVGGEEQMSEGVLGGAMLLAGEGGPS